VALRTVERPLIKVEEPLLVYRHVANSVTSMVCGRSEKMLAGYEIS
jgi:hypothetical protein